MLRKMKKNYRDKSCTYMTLRETLIDHRRRSSEVKVPEGKKIYLNVVQKLRKFFEILKKKIIEARKS
jgi:hypothetical protein